MVATFKLGKKTVMVPVVKRNFHTVWVKITDSDRFGFGTVRYIKRHIKKHGVSLSGG